MKKQMKKGDTEDDKLTPVKALVANGASVSCGADFTAVLTRDGEVFTHGLPQYGQLGHGTDHEYNTSANHQDCVRTAAAPETRRRERVR